VVRDQRPGEELAIYTADGKQHQLEQGSIRRIGNIDLAVLYFSSSAVYTIARISDATSIKGGSILYVSGFPLPSPAVPFRILRFLEGKAIAFATQPVPGGYKLLYSNPTLPGMSGGPVMNAKAELVAIHGQGEYDLKMTELTGVAVKTGTNQGIPISSSMIFDQFSLGSSGGAPGKPASAEEANTYMTMAAINLCALSQQKVPFKAALDGSVSMVASVFTERHGSRLAGSANPLSRDQIINATVAESILRSERFCGTKLPADWRKEYDTLLPQIRKALTPAGGRATGAK
jgi:hypothetical protein